MVLLHIFPAPAAHGFPLPTLETTSAKSKPLHSEHFLICSFGLAEHAVEGEFPQRFLAAGLVGWEIPRLMSNNRGLPPSAPA